MRQDWDTSGPELVATGVHRIPLPLPGDGLRAVNVYAIDDGGAIVLVDAGSGGTQSRAALDQGLATIGTTLADVSLVLATHGHYDHYGLTRRVREASGAQIALGADERALVDAVIEPERYRQSMEHRREWLTRHGAGSVVASHDRLAEGKGAQTLPSPRWLQPGRWLRDGEEVRLRTRTMRVHATPGHTRGHVVYHDEASRLLFAGDHVLPHITPSLGFEPFPDGNALDQFLRSLARVRNLEADLVLPGHGPTFARLHVRVDELIDHHRARLETCVAVLSDGGPRSAKAVADRMMWTRRERAFSDLDPFNRMLAVTETVAHLELLVRNGQVSPGCHQHERTYALAA
jgi:glyoxylase-like metal-dependent hydrolase (beta-lactamase superfamily II)